MYKDMIFVIFSFLLVAVSESYAGSSITGVVQKIIDGDSLIIVSGNKSIEVRLYGIDCPEYRQSFSNQAKKFARKRILGKTVQLIPQYYDSYNRLVAIVEKDGRSLNGAIVGAGLAWVYPRYCKKKICASWKEMEILARTKKRGLWAASHPIPPWKWKRMKKKY